MESFGENEFFELTERYFPLLVCHARRWASDPEDVVQSAFLKLVRHVRSGGKPKNLLAWLLTAVRTTAIDRLRRERRWRRFFRRKTSEAQDDFFTAASADHDAAMDPAAVTDALVRLDAGRYEIVLLRVWGECSFDEIAETLGISASTAARRYRESLAILKKILGES